MRFAEIFKTELFSKYGQKAGCYINEIYDIMISDVDLNPQEANKGIAFQVADDTLIQETGGIIQGMSGAPILQNGKVIGAVTHVFVDNPTKGYGIFIETMLEQGSDE